MKVIRVVLGDPWFPRWFLVALIATIIFVMFAFGRDIGWW